MKRKSPQNFLSSLRIKNKKKRAPRFWGVRKKAEEPKIEKKFPEKYKKSSIQIVTPQNLKNDEELVDINSLNIPLSNFEEIKAHTSTITALDVDQKGSKLATGSADYSIKLWDFHSATYPIEPFREPKDEEGGPIMGNTTVNEIVFSKDGKSFIVAPNSSCVKIFNYESLFLTESVQGDMYIQDKFNTKGHVGAVNNVCWHPVFKNSFLSCSIDGTMRLWDAEKCHQGNYQVVVTKGYQRRRIPCTCCCFSKDGKMFIGAVDDGTIHLYPTKGPYLRPLKIVNNAHSSNSHVSRIRTSKDGNYLVSRGGSDSTLKIWDFRKIDNPLKVFYNLVNIHDQTDICFSKDDRYILTGTSINKLNPNGQLIVVDKKSLKIVARKVFVNSSVVRIKWSYSLNQIFIGGTTDNVSVFYDKTSQRGILYPLKKKTSKKHIEGIQNPYEIFTPHALKIFQKKDPRGTQWAKNRRNPQVSHLPDEPAKSGVGRGGKLGTSHTQQLLLQLGVGADKSFLYKDPREELWEVAEAAKKNPVFIAPSYLKTQPKTLLKQPKKKKRGREDDDSSEKRFSKKRKV